MQNNPSIKNVVRTLLYTAFIYFLIWLVQKTKTPSIVVGMLAVTYMGYIAYLRLGNPLTPRRWAFVSLVSILGFLGLIALMYLVYHFS